MYELMSGERCQIWYRAAWRTFLFCKLGYRGVYNSCTWMTHFQSLLPFSKGCVKCKVAFHAVAFKLICILCALQSNSSGCLRCLVSLNALSMVILQFVQCYETELTVWFGLTNEVCHVQHSHAKSIFFILVQNPFKERLTLIIFRWLQFTTVL